MECAITAAQRGAEVELWEKTAPLGWPAVGGRWPQLKTDVADYASYLVNKTFRSNVRVRTMKDATAEEILAGRWDKVVMATGAHHKIPPIAGIDGSTVVCAEDVLTGRVRHSQS